MCSADRDYQGTEHRRAKRRHLLASFSLAVVLPGKGFSRPNQAGAPLYVPEGNRAVIEAFQATLRQGIPLLVPDLHINDPEFADIVANCMAQLLQGEGATRVATQFNQSHG